MNLTAEKMSEAMPNVMSNQFYGGIDSEYSLKDSEIHKIIEETRLQLQDDLAEATYKFGLSNLDKNATNWTTKYEQEMACNVIKGKIELLGEMEDKFNLSEPPDCI